MSGRKHIIGVLYYLAGVLFCIWLYTEGTGATLHGAFFSPLLDKSLHLAKLYNFFTNSILFLFISLLFYLTGIKISRVISENRKSIVPAIGTTLLYIVFCYAASVLFPAIGFIAFNLTGMTGIAPVLFFTFVIQVLILPSVLIYKIMLKLFL